MLDDGKVISLVPWNQLIEQRLGQRVAAMVRGSGVSLEMGESARAISGIALRPRLKQKRMFFCIIQLNY